VTAVHQFVPMLHRADAVGRHTLRLRDALVGRGIDSRIYVDLVDQDTAGETLPYTTYPSGARPRDVLVYQFATASSMARWLQQRPETLVVNYHNVTPPEHYAPWDNGVARHQLRAQEELRMLAPRAVLGLAVSAYNERELRQAGYASTAVVPPAAMLEAATFPATFPAVARLAGPGPAGGARWITLGRLAPNKAIEDVLAALVVARAHGDPEATLEVVGRPDVGSYGRALRRFADELGLGRAVRFAGARSDGEVADALSRADVYVVASRHEGFGVPVLEAMAAGLPVVANEAGALPEVVGEAGVLVDATDPYALAAAVDRALHDGPLRERLARAAPLRLATLDLASAADRAADAVAGVAGGQPG
jgi:glycosyltransferase involved in cell wall biosynthesis